jgi:hypothetical protein
LKKRREKRVGRENGKWGKLGLSWMIFGKAGKVR